MERRKFLGMIPVAAAAVALPSVALGETEIRAQEISNTEFHGNVRLIMGDDSYFTHNIIHGKSRLDWGLK